MEGKDIMIRCESHQKNEFRIEKLETDQSVTSSHIIDLIERVSKIEEFEKGIEEKVNAQSESTFAIVELAHELKRYSEKMETVIEQQAKILDLLSVHDDKITRLEHLPADKLYTSFEGLKSNWISALIGGGVTLIGSVFMDKLK
jgi:hypothetical protein